MIIDLAGFCKNGQPRWDALEDILDRLDESPGASLAAEEAVRFHNLSESVFCDLAELDSAARAPELRERLSRLAARACAVTRAVPRGARGSAASQESRFSARRWLFRTFPAAFRRHFAAFTLACAVTVAGAVFGAAAVALDPPARHVLMPFGHDRTNPSERVAKAEKRGLDGSHGSAGFSSMLFANNTRVSILALAGGIAFGAATVLLLFFNGAILGAIMLDYIVEGQSLFLAAWLLPHGAVEIPCILIAGQAGIVLGAALFGMRSRLRFAARMRLALPDIARLIAGATFLLVFAALVEAFLSQLHSPAIYPYKILFGAAELMLLAAYLLRCGKEARE